MVTVKNAQEISILRQGRGVMGAIFRDIKDMMASGVTPEEVDRGVEQMCQKHRVKPAFKGYMGFPACVCVSRNNVVVHGLPDHRSFEDGEIVGIDFGIIVNELYLDSAYTFAIGHVDETLKKLMSVTQASCLSGVSMARAGNTVQDISCAVERAIQPHGYGIVKGYVGHGIGYALHEDPQIPNYDTGETGITLKAGMTIAIEPMVNLGSEAVYVAQDKWAVCTQDGKPSAHYEHTVLITQDEPEILTQWPEDG